MTDLNIRVDMGRVQSSVQAAIRPAVEAALAETDIKAMIEQELKRLAPSRRGRMMYHFLVDGDSCETVLESMVRDGINSLAKEYVGRWIRDEQAHIEDAFRKMMLGSSNRLVSAFGKAVENAIKDDWEFELKVAVEHKAADDDEDGGCDD